MSNTFELKNFKEFTFDILEENKDNFEVALIIYKHEGFHGSGRIAKLNNKDILKIYNRYISKINIKHDISEIIKDAFIFSNNNICPTNIDEIIDEYILYLYNEHPEFKKYTKTFNIPMVCITIILAIIVFFIFR